LTLGLKPPADAFRTRLALKPASETQRKENAMTTETQPAKAATPPVAKLRVGLISASVWERAHEKGRFFAVTLERRYKDRDGKFKTSHSYDPGDLLALSKIADLAHTKILELQSSVSE
jgi:hypothetical protein